MVEVTSPHNLLRELFTIKGGGTLLKQGPEIQLLKGFQGSDKKKLKHLLETCFGKKPF
jgi:acetylglutamate synthase